MRWRRPRSDKLRKASLLLPNRCSPPCDLTWTSRTRPVATRATSDFVPCIRCIRYDRSAQAAERGRTHRRPPPRLRCLTYVLIWTRSDTRSMRYRSSGPYHRHLTMNRSPRSVSPSTASPPAGHLPSAHLPSAHLPSARAFRNCEQRLDVLCDLIDEELRQGPIADGELEEFVRKITGEVDLAMTEEDCWFDQSDFI